MMTQRIERLVKNTLLRGLTAMPEALPQNDGTPRFSAYVPAGVPTDQLAEWLRETFTDLGWTFWLPERPIAEVDFFFARPDLPGRIMVTNPTLTEMIWFNVRYDCRLIQMLLTHPHHGCSPQKNPVTSRGQVISC